MLQLKTTWYALLAGVLMVGMYAPWIPTFLKQNAQVQESYWVPEIGGWSIPDTFYRMLMPLSGAPAHRGVLILFSALPIIITLGAWAWLLVSCRDRSTSQMRLNMKDTAASPTACDASWLIVLMGVVPFLLSIALSFVGQSIYQDRFLVFTQIFILCAFANLIMRFPYKGMRVAGISVFIGGLLLAFGMYWNELQIPNRPGGHAAARHIFTERGQDDLVVVGSPFVYFAIDHYAQEEFNLPNSVFLHSETGELSHFAGGPILESQDLITPQEVEGTQAPVVWIVDTSGFGGSNTILSSQWLSGDRMVFPEVFPHQGDVYVTRYQKGL